MTFSIVCLRERTTGELSKIVSYKPIRILEARHATGSELYRCVVRQLAWKLERDVGGVCCC